MFWFAFVLLQLCTVPVFCFKKPETPCKLDDIKCMTDQAQDALITAVLGDVDNDVTPLDPMKQDLVIADLPGVRFTLSDSTVSGFKDAEITKMKMSLKSSLLIDMWLPRYEMIGDYEINCNMLATPIYAKGWYSINTTNVEILIDAEYKVYLKEGVEYCKINNFEIVTNTRKNMIWDANLYNEDKELADPVLQQLIEDPNLMKESLREPIITANLKTFFKNYNEVIERFPFADMVEMIV